jgi:hypothetical protein
MCPPDPFIDGVFCALSSHRRRFAGCGSRLRAQLDAEVAVEKIAIDVQPEVAKEVGVQSVEVYGGRTR